MLLSCPPLAFFSPPYFRRGLASLHVERAIKCFPRSLPTFPPHFHLSSRHNRRSLCCSLSPGRDFFDRPQRQRVTSPRPLVVFVSTARPQSNSQAFVGYLHKGLASWHLTPPCCWTHGPTENSYKTMVTTQNLLLLRHTVAATRVWELHINDFAFPQRPETAPLLPRTPYL